MATILRAGCLVSSRVRYLVIQNKLIYAPFSTTSKLNYWNKDWKPGPYPKTEEERIAAAEKYGLIPEDYEPYPEDDPDSRGDYPKLPEVSGAARDQYEPFDFPSLNRNYGEPLHRDADMLTSTRCDPNYRHLIPLWKQALMFLGVMSGFVALYIISEPFEFCLPRMDKQYPYKGEIHYTFEPVSDK